jgi:hypothetical protein
MRDCGCSFPGSCNGNTDFLESKSPFADKFSPGGESDFTPFQDPFAPELKGDPFIRPSNLIGPTDEHSTLPPSSAMSNKLQTIDVWTPNTEWGGGYGQFDGARDGTYLTIGAQAHAPLEGPRYSYAAMNTEELLEEAERRVAARQMFFHDDEGL